MVWKALDISIAKTVESQAEYNNVQTNRKALMNVLEQRIADRIAGIHYNPKETRAKYLEKAPGWGVQYVDGEDTELYYLAEDAGVNRLHCELFGLPVDDKYLLKLRATQNSKDGAV